MTRRGLLARGGEGAVIMVHGDGRIDRTCSGFYEPIRERFLRTGTAVFSWDRPGSGESRGHLARDSETLSQRGGIQVEAAPAE
jgi:alpha-beta hydrolase superfamily lysophospholipase